MVPSASAALPSRLAEFTGSVILISLPAFATGGTFAGAGFTVTVTVSVAVAPRSSVTFNSNWYTPTTRLFAVVCANPEFTMVNVAGPETTVHWNDALDPSESNPLPFRLKLFVGNVIDP